MSRNHLRYISSICNYRRRLDLTSSLSEKDITSVVDTATMEGEPTTSNTSPGNKRKIEFKVAQAAKKRPDDLDNIDLSVYQRRSYTKPIPLTDDEKLLIANIKTSCVDVDKIEQAIALRAKARLSCRLPEDFEDTTYYIENGLRKVYPYSYIYQCYTKKRWVGRRLIDVIRQEFRALTDEQLLQRYKLKYHLVNGKLAEIDYKLNNNDFVCNIVHRHELPVLATPIKIIHEDKKFVVIDKPPSMPIHPCGRYRHNSILNVMKKDYNYTDLYVVHRLDKLVSGVLIFARSSQQASILEKQIVGRDVEKEYVCRVEGEFPEDITVEKGLSTLSRKVGITIVDDEKGKPSKTVFRRLNFNGRTSTVLCKPLTGRMHQIRVHLQYLGFPIINDTLYNSKAFGEGKGKGAIYNKSLEQLLEDVVAEHRESSWIIPDEYEELEGTSEKDHTTTINKTGFKEFKENVMDKEVTLKALSHYFTESSWHELQEKYKFDKTKMHSDSNCFECGINYAEPPLSMLFLYLHALSYKGKDWSYKSALPNWANADWND